MTKNKMIKKQSKVLIVILSHNRENLTIRALESIKDTDYDNYEILIIDDDSEENSRIKLKQFLENFELKEKIIYKEVSPNKGWSGVLNIGLYEAIKNDSKYFILLGNDGIVTQNEWIKVLVEIAESDEMIGVAGSKVISPDKSTSGSALGISYKGLSPIEDHINEKNKKMTECDFVPFFGVLINLKVIDKIGFLDEGFLPMYYEDTDFTLRAKKAGYKIVYTPEISIIHDHPNREVEKGTIEKILLHKRNYLRLKLLNFPPLWLILSIPYDPYLRALLKRLKRNENSTVKIKTKNTQSNNQNSFIRKIIKGLFLYFPIVLWPNIKNLGEIMFKRRDRTRLIKSEIVEEYKSTFSE